MGSDEDSGNEDVLEMEYTDAEAEELKRNAEVRAVPSGCVCRSGREGSRGARGAPCALNRGMCQYCP